jgi:hypothetical protein
MLLNQFFRRLWQQRGSSDVQIKLLWVLNLAMTCLTWLQLAVWQDRGRNNFTIFKSSFYHLIHHQPLYTTFPSEHYDLFLYHPVFALLFAPIALLPAPIDMFVWLFGLTIVFLWAVTHLGLDKRWIVWVMLLSVFELSKNILHAQTNILITTGMMVSFIFFEKQKTTQAVLTSVFNFCIKGFGGATGLLAVLYPKSIRSIGQGIAFTCVLSLTPLLVVSPSELLKHYTDWFDLLRGDAITEPYSLVGFLTHTAHFPPSIEPFVLLFGVVILVGYWFILWLQRDELTTERRAYFLAFMLIWVVVFNRAAESATYIMASTGLLIWYFFHKNNGTTTKVMTIFFVICFYWVAIVCSDLALPFLKAFDKKYYFRPLFALMPMLWMLFDECKNLSIKTLKIKLSS